MTKAEFVFNKYAQNKKYSKGMDYMLPEVLTEATALPKYDTGTPDVKYLGLDAINGDEVYEPSLKFDGVSRILPSVSDFNVKGKLWDGIPEKYRIQWSNESANGNSDAASYAYLRAMQEKYNVRKTDTLPVNYVTPRIRRK